MVAVYAFILFKTSINFVIRSDLYLNDLENLCLEIQKPCSKPTDPGSHWCMTFADCRPQTADRRPQTADCRLQTADCRLQTADCRPQIADCKLKDTKNLPNKGDTIKNITSCESEKVAWEQGWYFCAKLHWPHFQDAVGYSSPTRLFIDSPGISLIALILYSSLIIVNW